MQYPKAVMSVSELKQMGFSPVELRNQAHISGQKFAWKTAGGGKILFDTEAYERWRTKRSI